MKNPSLEEVYLRLIEPSEFVKNFKTTSEFIDFLRIDSSGTHIQDLESILKVFEENELYEYCTHIKTVLEETIKKNTTMKILKYKLTTVKNKNIILMPVGAEILSIQIQGQYPCIWALVNPELEEVERVIEVYGTGHEILPTTGGIRKFITTVQFQQNLVLHFFELIN